MFINLLRCVVVLLSVLLWACSSEPIKENELYSNDSKEGLYGLNAWSFIGRLALKSKAESWQASIAWQHSFDEENIKLSGPLGQGAMSIRLANNQVFIDRGDGKIESSDHPEQFIKQQIGLFVPVRSLKYWVVGVPEPNASFISTMNGFKQAEWIVEYEQMQWVKSYKVPRKIIVTNAALKLRLVVDQWDFDDRKTK